MADPIRDGGGGHRLFRPLPRRPLLPATRAPSLSPWSIPMRRAPPPLRRNSAPSLQPTIAACIGRVDAVSIAVPTPLHYDIARELIEAGLHVLVEKPITDSVTSANALTELAEARNRVLQVGHIERFSSAYRTLAEMMTEPLYFESYRIAPWKNRGVEVDVILDLMIHDIDMIIGLANSAVESVDAVGTPVLGRNIDLANARITFDSGCVANVTASRVSYKTERRMRVFGRNQYLNCDLGEGKIFGYRLRGDPMTEGLAAIATETLRDREAGQSGQRDRRLPRLHCQRHQAAGRRSGRFRGSARRQHDQREHRGASRRGCRTPARPVGAEPSILG